MSKTTVAILASMNLLTLALVGVLAFVLIRGGVSPNPSTPTFDYVKAGVQLQPALADAVATAISQAAVELRGTDPMDTIKSRCVETYRKASGQAFDAIVTPGLDQIIPPGTTAPTADQRSRYADAFDLVAKGLKTR